MYFQFILEAPPQKVKTIQHCMLQFRYSLQKVNSNYECNMIKQKTIPQILGVHVFSFSLCNQSQKAETISVSNPSVKP